MKAILAKAKAITGSIRFWIVSLTAITAVLESIAAGTFTLAILFDTLKIYLGAVVLLGSVDSVATKYGAAKGAAGIVTPENQ